MFLAYLLCERKLLIKILKNNYLSVLHNYVIQHNYMVKNLYTESYKYLRRRLLFKEYFLILISLLLKSIKPSPYN